MKNFKIFLCLIISLVVFTNVEAAGPTASYGMDYSKCMVFSDVFKTITNNEGDYYYKYCYRATCNNNVYTQANMVGIYGYRCENGNGTPYIRVTSDGCKNFSGTCNTKNSTYCTKVEYIDCNRTSSGAAFKTSTTTTTTRRTTTRKTTTKKTTTTKSTTKTTTSNNTTKTTAKVTTTKTTTTKASLNNTYIKTIKINTIDIGYKNSKNEYSIKLPYGMNSVDVAVELEDELAKYEVVGDKDILDEDSEIKVIVTARDKKTKREVVIKIVRYTALSSECNLANIYMEDYKLDFSKNVYEYSLTLPKNVNSLDLEIVPVDEEKSSYEVLNNENLKNKSKVDIVVTAEDGTVCTYSIKIKKKSNTWKYILLIVLLFGALGTSVYFLYKYLKKSKGNYKYE